MGGRYSQEIDWRRVRVVNVGPVPAAGSDWSMTCPAGKLWRVLSAYAVLTTAATAGQRLPRLQLGDGTATYADVPPYNGQQASIAHRYLWFPGANPFQPVAGNPTTILAAAVSTAATGVVLSYTVPAGGPTLLTGASYRLIGGTAPVVALQIVRSATTVTLGTFSATQLLSLSIPLTAGDVVQWNVITLGAGSTGDFTLSGEPSSLAGTTDGEAVHLPETTLMPGWTIGTSTDNLAGTDQWSAPRLYVVETTVKPGSIDLEDVPDLTVGIFGMGA